MRLDAKTIGWAARRKISAETLRVMSVGADQVRFGERNLPAIVFNYTRFISPRVRWTPSR